MKKFSSYGPGGVTYSSEVDSLASDFSSDSASMSTLLGISLGPRACLRLLSAMLRPVITCFIASIKFPYMAEDVVAPNLDFRWFLRHSLLWVGIVLEEHYGMHPVEWAFVFWIREESLALDCWRNNVCHFGSFFWEVRGKVHLLPAVALLYGDAWEAELRSNRISLHEIYGSVWVEP